VVVVVALAYPAAAWLLGLSVAHQWEAREQHTLEQFPYIAVVKRDYRRGVYSSTEEVTYGLGGSILQSVRASGHSEWAGNVRFTVRNTIHHGPLPQLRAFAPATVDTQIVLPPEISAKLAAALGNKGELTIHTRMKWFGGGTTIAKISPFQIQTPQGGEFTWRGVDARADFGRDNDSHVGAFDSPGFSLKGPAANVNFGRFQLNDDMQRAFEAMNVGTVHVALADLGIELPNKDFKLTLQNIALDAKSQVTGEYLSTAATLSTGALQAQSFAATRIDYEFHLDHLHGPSAAALTQAIRAAQAEAISSSPPADPGPKIMEAFKTSGMDILLHDPVLDIQHTGFTTPDGQLVLAIKATVPGITRADLDGNPQLLIASLLKFLHATVDVRIDTALLDKLLDSSGKGDSITAQLQRLQRQGYIKLDGKALTTHLVYENRRLTVNDLPFPPMPTAMPGGPGMQGPGMQGPGMPMAPGKPRAPGVPSAPAAPH